MMNFKVSPLLVLGVLIGALGIGVSPAKAQTTQSIYDNFNNAKVAYVTNESEFYAALQMLFDLPSGTGSTNPYNQAPAIIRFVKAGVYYLNDVNASLPGSITYSIQGPGSFYMDPSGSTNITDPRTLNYGVTIEPYYQGAGRFITVRSGNNISISGVTLLGFGYDAHDFTYGEGPAWTNSSFHPNAYGGTIYNAGTLTLTNVTIASSTLVGYPSTIKVDPTSGKATPNSDKQGGSALGGAIYNTGTLTMRGCTLFNNSVTTDAFDDGTAALGGAIYSSGTLDIANCTLDNNHAIGVGEDKLDSNGDPNPNFYGHYTPTTVFGNGSDDGNLIAGGRLAGGGSIAIDGGSADIKNITVTDSSADSGYAQTDTDGAYGGGVYWRSGFSNPTNSIFTGNTTSSKGARPDFQYTRPTPYKAQFLPGHVVGPNVASGTAGDEEGLSYLNIFTFGLGGLHNLASFSTDFLTPLEDNGGPTLTRAPATINSAPVDNGILPYQDTAAEIANYLGGIDQRGAKRVIKGSSPNSSDTSNGTPIVDIGAVEAEFSTDLGNPLIKQGGNTAPFIQRPSDSGSTNVDDANGDPNHDITVSGVQVKDADSYDSSDPSVHNEIVQVTIDFPDGKIMTDFSTKPGITVVSASADGHTVVIRGTIDAINAALADGLTLYRSDGTVDYPPDFSITVDDLGNNGYGGDQIYSDITTHNLIDPAYNPAIYINPQNHPPHVSVPGTQYVKLNGSSTDYNTVVFSTANGNAIYVSDPDINAPIDPTTGQGTQLPPGYDRSGLHLQVTLSASNGTISLGGNGSGISVIGSSSSNNGSTTLTIEGTPTALNLALNGMTYRPNTGTLSDTIQIHVDDLGNYGQGGPMSADASIPIKINKTGTGGDHSSNVRWEVSPAHLNGNTVEFTYTLINLSNTDITNITASGSITGGGYFDTANVTFAPSIGYNTDISQDYLSPKLQRDLDPTKNGLAIVWGLKDPQNNAYILRQGQSAFLRVTVPVDLSAVGKQIAGPWKISFTKLDPNGNAVVPGPTPAVIVQP
jgi:hypothetical protein